MRSSRGGIDDMLVLILEALGAGALLVAIVWWTMFAGRSGGEPAAEDEDEPGANGPR